jgi:hypothetical protein
MIAWTPYAVIAMYIVFIDSKGVSPLAETVPSMLAKVYKTFEYELNLKLDSKINLKVKSFVDFSSLLDFKQKH